MAEEQGTPAPEGRKARNTMIAVGVAGLLLGLILGAAAGGSDTKTVTEVRHDVSTETTTVPVVHVRTVRKVRRVVRTRTVTVQAPASSGSSSSSASDTGSGGSDGSQYAGMNCSEIGHSFRVTPGSDPEHDADNDGIACESYP